VITVHLDYFIKSITEVLLNGIGHALLRCAVDERDFGIGDFPYENFKFACADLQQFEKHSVFAFEEVHQTNLQVNKLVNYLHS
jgi:hypothetical protein